jgi:hypothetical protein
MASKSRFLLALVLVTTASGTGAVELFRKGDFEARLDTTLSIGASMRVSDRDSDTIFVENGGAATNPEYLNRDDGDLNYDQWDVFSASAKALLELDMRWRNLGAFVRSNLFYDAIGNCDTCTRRTDLTSQARHRDSVVEGGVIGAQFLILDAYADAQFDVLDRPLGLRAGRQVVSWGQSIFIQGGINQTNAIDVAKVRSPGVDFGREALFPATIAKVSTEIFENLGLEAYYQLEWNRTFLDPLGAYFSQSDTTGRGADALYFGVAPRLDLLNPQDPPPMGDPGSNPVLPALGEIPASELFGNPYVPPFPGCGGVNEDLTRQRACDASDLVDVFAGVPRASDDDPTSQGQWGFALRYFLESIQSEVAAYYMRYHAKTPVIGFKGIVVNVPIEGQLVATNQPTDYFRQYAPYVSLYGISLDAEIFDIAIGVEASYRPNDPVVLNPNAIIEGPALADVGDPKGFEIDGYEREERYQFQLNGQYNVPPGNRLIGPLVEWIRADNLIFIAEAALVSYPNLDRKTPYAGPPDNPVSREVDENSWGYQLLLQAPYSNPLGVPIDLTPRVIWQHDVRGNTPNLLPFIEDRLGISAGVTIDYLQTWSFDVGYTNFFNAGPSDVLHDRDFVSATVKYRY